MKIFDIIKELKSDDKELEIAYKLLINIFLQILFYRILILY
mgnify:CR=1 FL=1